MTHVSVLGGGKTHPETMKKQNQQLKFGHKLTFRKGRGKTWAKLAGTDVNLLYLELCSPTKTQKVLSKAHFCQKK